MSQIRYQYYVEGECEKKLIEEFKARKNMILLRENHSTECNRG